MLRAAAKGLLSLITNNIPWPVCVSHCLHNTFCQRCDFLSNSLVFSARRQSQGKGRESVQLLLEQGLDWLSFCQGRKKINVDFTLRHHCYMKWASSLGWVPHLFQANRFRLSKSNFPRALCVPHGRDNGDAQRHDHTLVGTNNQPACFCAGAGQT